MKPKHVESERFHARQTLQWCNIHLGADFHALSSAQVDKLLQAADQARYQKPRQANGSRARYFHDLLQRRARAWT